MSHLPKRHRQETPAPDYAHRFKGAGYKTIAEAVQAFNDLACLPEDENLTRMDDCDGLELTFVSKRAKFHTARSLKCNKNENSTCC